MTAPVVESSTELAVDRSLMAAERTLMAWIRTSISLIGFGFTLYKFLQFELEKDGTAALAPLHLQGPRNLALTFIGLAIFSLSSACLQYRHYTRQLRRQGLARIDVTLITAFVVAAIGLLALANVAFRIGPF